MVTAPFLAGLLVSALLAAPTSAGNLGRAPRCKCTANNSCWPSQRAFSSLARRLSNPLINVTPISQPCFAPTFNEDQCEVVHDRFNDGIWRTDQPGAMMSANWEAADGMTTSCHFNNSATGTCQQGRVPVIGVNATTVRDVQEAVKFAAENNLKVVVKNTGHDFLGRSAAEGSFVIWTHTWKYMNYTANFTPTGGRPSRLPAVTIGPGVQWGELYHFVSTVDKTIAGGIGAQGSVGAAGGWPLGGGHNILSPQLGLGVDNILQITVVTPDGEHVTANANRNADLFWALRGGGGPNFGVATSITYRLHDDLPLYAYFFQATFSPDVFEQVMTAWHTVVPNITDEGWAGYYPFANNFLALMYLLRDGDATRANATSLVQFLDVVQTIPTVQVITSESKLYEGYYEWFDENIGHPVNVIGFNYTGGAVLGNPSNPASWLIPRDLFSGADNLAKLSTAFKDFPIAIGQHVGGPAVARNPGNSMAAHPGWRTSLVDVAIAGFWDFNATPDEVRAVRQAVTDSMAKTRALTTGDKYAQYLNEPDLLVPDWQAANWGSNYPRLLRLKQRYDPQNLFIVKQGVGSEFWDDNQLCRLHA